MGFSKRRIVALMEQFAGRVIGGNGVGAADPLDEDGDLAGDGRTFALARARRPCTFTPGPSVQRCGRPHRDLAGRIDHRGDVAGLRRLLDPEQVVEGGDAVGLAGGPGSRTQQPRPPD